MKNDEFIKNELARAEKEIELWKERSKSWNKKIRDVIGDVTLNMYKNINETGEFRFLIKDQLIYLVNSLFDVKPLTPLTDNDEEWNERIIPVELSQKTGIIHKYQNNRYRDLFKEVYSDGTVKYHDNNRVACFDPIMENYYQFGLANLVYDEMDPIKMPYWPEKEPVCLEVFTFQADQSVKEESNFDTVAIIKKYEETSEDGDIVTPINRFFREPKKDENPTLGNWVEIDIFELKERIEASAMKNLDLSDLGLDDVYKEACTKKGI